MNTGHTHYRQRHGERIVDEAADWFSLLQDPESKPEDREAFAQWLSASAEHVREYLALTALRTNLSQLKSTQTVDELLQLAQSGHADNVIPLDLHGDRKTLSPPRAGEEEGARGSGRARLYAIAAGLAAIALTAFFFLRTNPNTVTYTTERGEQKSFTLPDGSVVTLNAVSELKLNFTDKYRDIRLETGEALFEVAKNPHRPFRVLTNDAIIQAVGTRFNVYHRRADTTVSVVEGTVEIQPAHDEKNQSSKPAPAPIRVIKGQRAHVDLASQLAKLDTASVVSAASQPVTVTAANTEADTAWRQRRLIFESKPLGAIVEEFNLYNDTRLTVTDPKLSDLQISGNFNANDPHSFALFLQEAKLATTEEKNNGTIQLAPR